MDTFGFINFMLNGKDENGENVPRLKSNEVVFLVHCKIVNNDYQQDSRFLYTFVPNESFVQ